MYTNARYHYRQHIQQNFDWIDGFGMGLLALVPVILFAIFFLAHRINVHNLVLREDQIAVAIVAVPIAFLSSFAVSYFLNVSLNDRLVPFLFLTLLVQLVLTLFFWNYVESREYLASPRYGAISLLALSVGSAMLCNLIYWLYQEPKILLICWSGLIYALPFLVLVEAGFLLNQTEIVFLGFISALVVSMWTNLDRAVKTFKRYFHLYLFAQFGFAVIVTLIAVLLFHIQQTQELGWLGYLNLLWLMVGMLAVRISFSLGKLQV